MLALYSVSFWLYFFYSHKLFGGKLSYIMTEIGEGAVVEEPCFELMSSSAQLHRQTACSHHQYWSRPHKGTVLYHLPLQWWTVVWLILVPRPAKQTNWAALSCIWLMHDFEYLSLALYFPSFPPGLIWAGSGVRTVRMWSSQYSSWIKHTNTDLQLHH